MDTTEVTAGPETHFSGGLVFKLSGEEMLSILAFTYKMPDSRQIQMRLPGGTSRPGERPFDTLTRELQDEISDESKPFSLLSGNAHELYKKTVPGDPKKGGGIHHKIFFAILDSDLSCSLRRGSMYEPDGVLLGPPSLHEAESLVDSMFYDRTPKTHPVAVLKLIETLAEMYPLVSMRYRNLLSGNEPFMKAWGS